MSDEDCTSRRWPGVVCDHLYRDCRNLRGPARPWEASCILIDPHGAFVCGMCLHRHNRTTHKGAA
jgi:hypothetical protein